MGISSFSKSIERRFAWSFAGFILGTISLAMAISIFYLSKRESRTDLKVVVDDEVNLVEIKEEIPRLRILYDDEDILKSKKEIKLLRITVQNEGKTILQNDYDIYKEFGIKFIGSTLLGVTLIDANSNYLRENLKKEEQKISQEGDPAFARISDTLRFSKVIFEKGKYVRFKVVLIQQKGIRRTELTPLGKISGMETIPVVYREPPGLTTIKGEGGPSFGKVMAYVGLGYIGMILLMFIVIGATETVRGRKRKKAVYMFLSKNPNLTTSERQIIESYEEGWNPRYLSLIRSIIEKKDTLDLSEFIKKEVDSRIGRSPLRVSIYLFGPAARRFTTLSLMPEVFARDGVSLTLNPENKEFLLRFLRFTGDIEEEVIQQAGRGERE